MSEYTDREKLLARIRKCMALSKSSNEYEAAAALRQAQKIMATHGITDDEVSGLEYTTDFVDHNDYKYGKVKPLTIVSVIALMQHAFGVDAVFERSPSGMHRVRYFGRSASVMLATHSHVVVYRAASAAWRQYLNDSPQLIGLRGARASFVRGWCVAVTEKIEALVPNEEEQKRVAVKLAQFYGAGGTGTTSIGTRRLYGDIMRAGSLAGGEFSINRPVSSDRRYLRYSK